MSKVDELIQTLRTTRQQLADLVADIPNEQEIYPTWRVKELLAHFAGWDDAVLIALRAFLAGADPVIVAPRGPDHYNDRTVTEREALPLSHIIKEWQLNRELVLDLVAQLSDDRLDTEVVYPWGEKGNLNGLIAGLSEHEQYHIGEIEAIKAQM